MDLIDLKIMGASTQAFMNSVEVAEDGGIDVWLENEVGPTVSPANPETIKQMLGLMQQPKFISLPPLKMFKNGELVDIEVNPEEDPVSLADEVDKILSDEEEEENPATDADPQLVTIDLDTLNKTIESIVKAQMSVFIELWGSDIEEARSAIMTMMGSAKSAEAITDKLDTMFRGQEDMKKAFLGFAKYLREMKLATAAKEYNRMSQIEKDLLEDDDEDSQHNKPRKYQGVAPAGAPGTY
jgi:hypothetical protein